MGIYILTFLLTFILDDYNLITKLEIENNLKTLMYGYNFVFSMIFSYILITIFAKNNDNYIKLIEKANKQLNIEIEQKNKMNEKLEETLKEKDILLAEVHHRVKNNLSYISGLLELQNFYVKDNKLSNILNDTSARIKSIAPKTMIKSEIIQPLVILGKTCMWAKLGVRIRNRYGVLPPSLTT